MRQELLKAGAVKRMSLATAMTLLILGGFVAITVASPPSGVLADTARAWHLPRLQSQDRSRVAD